MERDLLTGLYNINTAEKKSNERLEAYHRGVLLLLDIDNFKEINNHYGHLVGDSLLNEIARSLHTMFLKTDIIGRIGGNKFVIFLTVNQGEQFAASRANQLKEMLKGVEVKNCQLAISVTTGYSIFQEGDNYKSLLQRADKKLCTEKQKRKKAGNNIDHMARGIEMDVLRIQSELKGYVQPEGGFYQDYEAFKSIYQFVERRLLRTDTGVYIVLMTLTDEKKNYLQLEKNLEGMNILKTTIGKNLRAGDTFTAYSSCQYLIMLADVHNVEAERIAKRITEAFYQQANTACRNFLLHCCYPMNFNK